VLVVIDDAERVEDPAGRLAALVAERRPGVLVVAAGRPDALRPMFGHWTSVVRRSRIGVLLAACADVDGDLLGELLPRRRPLPPRPGLAWLVDGAGRRLVQVAT
jgi:S-DNA-T family DNA segregation ATPase FtsK/SpoIIIE